MGRVHQPLLLFVTFLIVFLSVTSLTVGRTTPFKKPDGSSRLNDEKIIGHLIIHGLVPGIPGLGGLPFTGWNWWGGFPGSGGFPWGRGGYPGGRGLFPWGLGFFPGGFGGFPGGLGGIWGGRGGFAGLAQGCR